MALDDVSPVGFKNSENSHSPFLMSQIAKKPNPKQKTANLGLSQKKEITGYFGVPSPLSAAPTFPAILDKRANMRPSSDRLFVRRI